MTRRIALIATAGLVALTGALAIGADAAPRVRTLDFDSRCASTTTIETPYVPEGWNPGGASFTVDADTPGTYTVRCDGALVERRVVS
jgi:hypothetical protein